MRVCDVCHLASVDCRLYDGVMSILLRSADLSAATISFIIDKLQIRTSAYSEPSSKYGDICQKCANIVAQQVKKLIEESNAKLADDILAMVSKTIPQKTEAEERAAWFHSVSEDKYYIRK